MKISIDTKEDSAEDLKKVVSMLQALLDDRSGGYVNMFDSGSSESGQDPSGNSQDISPGLFNIFGDSGQQDSDPASSQEIIAGAGADDNDPDDMPKIITY